jgi:prophage antirepressor-like protein
MENKLEIFNSTEFGSVRVIQEGDRYLFCGLDVAAALGYAKPRNAITAHCRYALKRGVPHPQAENKELDMLFIPEGDVYRLITHSKLPSADRFEKWVFDEVLPDIRRHGAYMTKPVLEQVLENPELVLLMAQRMLEERQKNEQLQQALRVAKPKADYYDAFIHPESCTNIRATAKELKVPEKMFIAFLLRKRYLYRAPSGTLLPYAKPASDGLFQVKDYVAVNGHQGVYTLVTPKGKALFLTMLAEIA